MRGHGVLEDVRERLLDDAIGGDGDPTGDGVRLPFDTQLDIESCLSNLID